MMILIPITCQNMIIYYIDDNAGIPSLGRPEPSNSFFHQLMLIGKLVNGAMQLNPFGHTIRKLLKGISFHRIRNKIPQQQFVIIGCKKNVSEEIHRCLKLRQKEGELKI